LTGLYRVFFKTDDMEGHNSESHYSAKKVDPKSDGSPQIKTLRRWFKSLSIQERINELSTTFPFFVSKLVEAHNELRETSVLS
jgi:hypothetical protein